MPRPATAQDAVVSQNVNLRDDPSTQDPAIRLMFPAAAASLREGLSEMFTINRLGLPPQLRKCLGSTNLIDSTHSGVRQKTRRVTNWKHGAMALRWAGGHLRRD